MNLYQNGSWLRGWQLCVHVTCATQICFFQLSSHGTQTSVHANEEDLKKEGKGHKEASSLQLYFLMLTSPSTIPTPQGHLLRMVLASRSWKVSFFPILCQLQDRNSSQGFICTLGCFSFGFTLPSHV